MVMLKTYLGSFWSKGRIADKHFIQNHSERPPEQNVMLQHFIEELADDADGDDNADDDDDDDDGDGDDDDGDGDAHQSHLLS